MPPESKDLRLHLLLLVRFNHPQIVISTGGGALCRRSGEICFSTQTLTLANAAPLRLPHRATPSSPARISARCKVRTPVFCRCSAP